MSCVRIFFPLWLFGLYFSGRSSVVFMHILSIMAFWIVFQWEVECSVYAYSFHYGILDCISVGGRV